MPSCPACGVAVDHAAVLCPKCGGRFAAPTLELWESRISPQQEAAMRTPGWLLPLLGIAGIGGGAWGMLSLVMAFAGGQFASVWNALIGLAMVALDLFAIWCGVAALQRRPGWLRLNQLLWVLQVPAITSPLLAFAFSVGGFVTPYFSLPPLRVGINAWLGSVVQFHLLANLPWGLGVNVIALVVVVYLFRLQARAAGPAELTPPASPAPR